MNIYTVKSTDIVHNTSVDLITRWFTKEVHIVQYDNSQPIVAVELFKNSERFVLPDGYEANLRFGKKDRTFIYKPVLGCNQGRDTVYFAVDEQMSMFYGKVNPIIELTYNGAVVGSSSIPFVIDRNPIQIGDVESKSDYPAIIEHISAAEAAAADAKKAVDAEAVERADGDAKTLSDARAYTDSSVEDLNPLKSDITVLKTDNQTNKTTLTGLVSDNTTIKSNITTLQSDVASLKTDNTQNKTDIATKQDKLVSGTNIKTINGESILGSGSIAISGGSGLASPWISEEKCIGITDNQGFYMGLLNVFGSALYGEIVYDSNNSDHPPLAECVMGLSCDDTTNDIILFSDTETNVNSLVSLPEDFKTRSQIINLGDIATKQDKLVSGTNIKTINGESILGSGSIAISGGSGLASPWISEEKCIGITDNQGFYMGLLNVFGSALYGEIVYDSNNSDHPPLAECVMGLSCDDTTNDIILFSDTETNVNSLVSLPEDFKTRSQIINLGDIATKQDKLVSGTNIKTINGESILGSGNITISGGSGSEMPPLYSHTITLKDSGNSAYFTFTIYVRTDEVITKNTLLDNLSWDVCVGTGVVSNSLIDKITFDRYADNTWVHQFLELSGQHIDKELRFDSVFGTDFTVEDVVRGPDWIPPR